MATLKRQKNSFQDRLSLNAGQKYCRMLQIGNLQLQFFPPSLSYQLSLIPLFCLFLSGRFTQVLLYMTNHSARPVEASVCSNQSGLLAQLLAPSCRLISVVEQ